MNIAAYAQSDDEIIEEIITITIEILTDS
jgi:hypothetical protein